MKNFQKTTKGSILVIVLWMLGLLTVFAVYLGAGVRQRLEFLDRLETRDKLYFIAQAGIKQAVSVIGNFDKDKAYIGLNDPWSNNGIFSQYALADGWFSVGYSSAADDFSAVSSDASGEKTALGAQDCQSRLNINTAGREELARLFEEAASVEGRAAEALAECIIDWRDSDNMSGPNGAEDEYYRGLHVSYECKDAPFASLEELRYLKGMTPAVFLNAKKYLTVHGSGMVNINTAPRKVLLALGFSEGLVKKIVAFRCGEDGMALTRDDRVFVSSFDAVAQLSQVNSLSPEEAAQFSNIISQGKITVFSDIFVITSESRLNNKDGVCRVECVFKKNMELTSKKAGYIVSWRVKYFI